MDVVDGLLVSVARSTEKHRSVSERGVPVLGGLQEVRDWVTHAWDDIDELPFRRW